MPTPLQPYDAICGCGLEPPHWVERPGIDAPRPDHEDVIVFMIDNARCALPEPTHKIVMPRSVDPG